MVWIAFCTFLWYRWPYLTHGLYEAYIVISPYYTLCSGLRYGAYIDISYHDLDVVCLQSMLVWGTMNSIMSCVTWACEKKYTNVVHFSCDMGKYRTAPLTPYSLDEWMNTHITLRWTPLAYHHIYSHRDANFISLNFQPLKLCLAPTTSSGWKLLIFV